MANARPSQQRILILDFGAQYSQLIARRVRELQVYCEILPYDASAARIREFAAAGIILSGGPASAYAAQRPSAPPVVFQLGVPLLGICYGMQAMVVQLGGQVEYAANHEYGQAVVHTQRASNLLGAAAAELSVWMSHADRVTALPDGFAVLATTPNSPYAAIADEARHYYGLQFHPEVTHTHAGQQILSSFVHGICACARQWSTPNIIAALSDDIRQQVGDQAVILGLSGGVDSAVVAALLARAIGPQLTCIFVDTGLLRHHEAAQVMAAAAQMQLKVIRVEAAAQFLQRLAGVTDPEQKRQRIGHLFVDLFETAASKLSDARWLAQGTIYPDVIESAGTASAMAASHSAGKPNVIKSHHNVALPATMRLKLLEPLRELFKDEVRQLGRQLGLPEALVTRQPFPGPGLAVRILGEVTQSAVAIVRQADAIFLEELQRHDLYASIAQAFAVFLPIKSVGVVGDNRAYDYVVALRAVESTDFMTANWAALPHHVLAQVSSRIINEVRGVSRVVYDISNKPPATIEWE